MSDKKIAVIGKSCVACGVCVGICPLGAVFIEKGVTAKVIAEKCVGCGKCEKACPGGIIHIRKAVPVNA